MQKTIKMSPWGSGLGIIVCAAAAVGLFHAASANHSYYWFALALVLVAVLVLFSLLRTAIILDEQGITSQGLFSSKTIAWADVQKAELDMGTQVVTTRETLANGSSRMGTSLQSYANLSIWDNKNFITNPLIINMKSFPRSAVPAIASAFAGKVDPSKLVNLSNYAQNTTAQL